MKESIILQFRSEKIHAKCFQQPENASLANRIELIESHSEPRKMPKAWKILVKVLPKRAPILHPNRQIQKVPPLLNRYILKKEMCYSDSEIDDIDQLLMVVLKTKVPDCLGI